MYVILLLAVAATVVGTRTPVQANSAREQLRRTQKQHLQMQAKIQQLKQQKGQVQDLIQSYTDKINSKQDEVRAVEKQLKQTEASLAKAQGEKKQIEANLSGYRGALSGRMRSIYMMGDMTYLDLLFSADNFSDFVDRVFFIQTICGRDQDLIDKTQHDQELLAEKLDQIQQKRDQIAQIRVEERTKLGELNDVKRQKDDDLESINNNLQLSQEADKALMAQSAMFEQLIRSNSHSAGAYKGKAWTCKFCKPAPGPIVSGFGMRFHPVLHYSRMHTGVDIGAGYGTPIKAAGDGKVIRAGSFGGYGNCVIIDHGGSPNRSTLYGHMSRILCVEGEVVKAGTVIGEVGATGLATGPHLHFEVRINGTPVDPLSY